MAFQNQTMELSHWPRADYLIQQNISFQDWAMTVTRKGVLKQHSNYIKNFKIYLIALGALMVQFHCSLSQTVSHTRHLWDAWHMHFKTCFKEELERLQKQYIIAPLGIDETSEWCKSFVLVAKANGKVRLCLDPAQLNQALIRPIHRGPSLNDILPKLNNATYLSLIDASSGYHNLRLDNKSSYFTMCASLGDTDIKGYHLEQHWQVTCSKEKLMKYLRICQMYSVSWIIY